MMLAHEIIAAASQFGEFPFSSKKGSLIEEKRLGNVRARRRDPRCDVGYRVLCHALLP
jgi:hypothetical protein